MDAGINTVIVPKANAQDIVLGADALSRVVIVPVGTFYDVLSVVLADSRKKTAILSSVRKEYA